MRPGCLLLRALLQERERRFGFRFARPCRACAGRGECFGLAVWRGRRECRACRGRGMLGG